MEMHLVHKSADDKLAVVGVFIAEGAHNKAFDPVGESTKAEVETPTPRSRWTSTLPCQPSAPVSLRRFAHHAALLGCELIVSRRSPIELERAVGAFTRLIQHNNRPVQNLNRTNHSD
jgi:carbonic anhydrase